MIDKYIVQSSYIQGKKLKQTTIVLVHKILIFIVLKSSVPGVIMNNSLSQ